MNEDDVDRPPDVGVTRRFVVPPSGGLSSRPIDHDGPKAALRTGGDLLMQYRRGADWPVGVGPWFRGHAASDSG